LAIATANHFYLCRSLLAGGCIGQTANLCCLFFFLLKNKGGCRQSRHPENGKCKSDNG
jgi:hypothetical protein